MCAFFPPRAAAQGVQTGTITGTVKSSDGVAIVDAAVVVTSPALQGERTALTDVNGVYSVANLPPGLTRFDSSRRGSAPPNESRCSRSGTTASVDATAVGRASD